MNHQYGGRSQKSRGIKAKHVLLVILIFVMGIWSLFQIKHSGYKLLVKKLKDGSFGRKGLVESIDRSEMDFHDGNVVVEITSEEESGNGDDHEKVEESQAEELFKEVLLGSVDNSTGVLSSDSGEESQEDADEAKLGTEKSEGPNGNNDFQDENGIPPEGHESNMSASFEPRNGGLSIDEKTGKDSGTTKILEEADGSIETNGPDDNADDDKDVNVDTHNDENLETQQ